VGSLNVPLAGIVYFDAPIAIYTVANDTRYMPVLRQFWSAVGSGSITPITSELTLLEVLVHPLRNRDVKVQQDFERLLDAPVRLLSIATDVLRKAAELRAASAHLRTPDAIHAASAVLRGAKTFLTNDAKLKTLSGLNVVLLDEWINQP
jgi:predicted nucleic acid-binding protein